MTEDEPDLVTSDRSQKITVEGFQFSIEIFRLYTDDTWTLEVVDQQGTSHIWSDQFTSDEDACTAAAEAIKSEGAIAFMGGADNNVIPIRPS